jgi:hypothetical protein
MADLELETVLVCTICGRIHGGGRISGFGADHPELAGEAFRAGRDLQALAGDMRAFIEAEFGYDSDSPVLSRLLGEIEHKISLLLPAGTNLVCRECLSRRFVAVRCRQCGRAVAYLRANRCYNGVYLTGSDLLHTERCGSCGGKEEPLMIAEFGKPVGEPG